MALIREEDRYYTAREMAQALSVTIQTIERMKKDGDRKSTRLNSSHVF